MEQIRDWDLQVDKILAKQISTLNIHNIICDYNKRCRQKIINKTNSKITIYSAINMSKVRLHNAYCLKLCDNMKP